MPFVAASLSFLFSHAIVQLEEGVQRCENRVVETMLL